MFSYLNFLLLSSEDFFKNPEERLTDKLKAESILPNLPWENYWAPTPT